MTVLMEVDVRQPPKVSIITPVYRVESYLRRCLDSICGQTLEDIEILAINDASPDGCGPILEEYARQDERISLITHEQNQGAAAARNSGLTVARGKYIGFVDADDAIDPTMYEVLVRYAEEANADMVYSAFRIVRGDGSCQAPPVPDDSLYDLENIDDRRKAIRRLGFSCVNKLFRREAIREVRFPPLVFTQDGAFVVACFCRCRIVRSVPCVPYICFARTTSSTKTYTMGGIDAWGRYLELAKALLRERGYGGLWPELASGARTLILKHMVAAIYVHPDPAERRQLWQKCLKRYVPILVEPGFQPFWIRLWLRAMFATRSISIAYWGASVPSRLEDKCVGKARSILKTARQRVLRAMTADCWASIGRRMFARPKH